MSAYLGDSGTIEIRRDQDGVEALLSTLDPDDVNVDTRRFSFDFNPGALITGDQVEIGVVGGGANLELVANHPYPDGYWFVHVDNVGSCRLYDSFEDALNGEYSNAKELIAPAAAQDIYAHTRNSTYRCVAQVKEYSFTTSRLAVDTTSLSDEFVQQYEAGLISGQGTLMTIWDYQAQLCDPMQPDTKAEEPNYFAQLVLRLQQGARFDGRFYINATTKGKFVWWEAACVVTNVVLNFSPTQIIQAQIEFVTTGEVRLLMGQPPSFVLQEDDGFINLEGQAGRLELET